MTLRWVTGFAALGSALASCWCHDWLAAAVAGAIALIPLTAWVRSELAATRKVRQAFDRTAAVTDALIAERSRMTWNTAPRL